MKQIASSTFFQLPSPLPHLYKLWKLPSQPSIISHHVPFVYPVNPQSFQPQSFFCQIFTPHYKMVNVFYLSLSHSLHILYSLLTPCHLPTSMPVPPHPILSTHTSLSKHRCSTRHCSWSLARGRDHTLQLGLTASTKSSISLSIAQRIIICQLDIDPFKNCVTKRHRLHNNGTVGKSVGKAMEFVRSVSSAQQSTSESELVELLSALNAPKLKLLCK